MDATENDLPAGAPFQIQGFPTIKFFPSNQKGSPIEYEGDRSFDNFVEFIKTHNTKNLEFSGIGDSDASSNEEDEEEHLEL
jgi:protein disulfide-isomerase A1